MGKIGFKHSAETKAKMRASKIGHKGCVHTPAYKARMSVLAKERVGSKNGNWRGGITPLGVKIRGSAEYKAWRDAVFARDNWTCQRCPTRGGNLEAHHIKPFAKHPELRLDVDNGITYCVPCHKIEDKHRQ